MVYYRVVSTKLTEEEHGKLIDVCNLRGCPPSALIRDAIMKIINSEQKTPQKVDPMQRPTKESNTKSQQTNRELFNSDIERLLGTS
jgi:coenzyme F420-reducing hydrogenase gamma subunit